MITIQSIDITSLLILFVAICIAIAVFFTLEAILFKKRDRNTLIYIASKYMQALAVGILLVSGYGNNTVLIILGNIFYFLGFGGEIYIIAALKRYRYRWVKRVFVAVILLGMLYVVLNVSMHFLVAYRIFAVGVFTFFLYIFLGLVLLLIKGNSKMLRVTGWISLVFSIPWVFKTYYTLMNLSTASILHSNVFQTPAYIGNIVFFSVLPLLYLFIFKERDQQKLQEHYRKIVAQNEEILNVNKKLKAMNATKDNFFKIIGHDLKGPMGNMVQYYQFIEEGYNELSRDEISNLFKILQESSIRVYKLLENLLEWARAQTGDISFHPETVSPSALIMENIELFEKQAETKNIKITTADFYTGTVKADKNMINTVVRNLLSNAIKFTENGGQIEISNKRDEQHIIISVKDNGTGMSPEDSSRLFQIGAGLSNTGTNNEKGTGLGLIICKEFVDKHKGSIWVESKPGKGSVFSFSIPLDIDLQISNEELQMANSKLQVNSNV